MPVSILTISRPTFPEPPSGPRTAADRLALESERRFPWASQSQLDNRRAAGLSPAVRGASASPARPQLSGSVRVGGPMAPEQVWLVYRAEERFAGIEGQFDVGPGV